MDTARKITVEVPLELLEKAQRASGTGVTQTVRDRGRHKQLGCLSGRERW